MVYKEQPLLEACLRCGECVWRKGLLTKGPGICHGIAGSGYVFLTLYRLTGDRKQLYRARRFAQALDDKTIMGQLGRPDCPFSLFEGIAGTVCYLRDVLSPDTAAFPFMDIFFESFN